MERAPTVCDVASYINNAPKVTLILGAGASKSAGIPLAGELVDRIHSEYRHCLSRVPEDKHYDYGTVMAALSPTDRKQLLRDCLESEDVTMNWGHLVLAHMLLQKKTIGRVLSCNFDNLLEQALSLLGRHLPVYDFGIAPTSHPSDLADQAIIHLHGQGDGLRMLNSNKETQSHARKLRPLFKECLHDHLTVVIGYSGEADSIFNIIKSVYHDNSTLLWLGYKEEKPDHLKDFFASHAYAHYVGGCSFDETMLRIAQHLPIEWPPALLFNPLQHVHTILDKLPSLPPLLEFEKQPFDILEHMKERLQKTQKNWEEQYTNENEAIRRYLSGERIEGDTPEARSLQMRQLIIDGLQEVQDALKAPPPEQAARFNTAETLFRSALATKGDHTALVYTVWGVSLSLYVDHLTNKNEKFSILQKAEEKFCKATEINIKDDVAFGSWGTTLTQKASLLSDTNEKITTLQNAEEKFRKAIEINPKSDVALSDWGTTLTQKASLLSDTDEKIITFQSAEEKFRKVIEINPKNDVVLSNWGIALAQKASLLSDTDEKITTLQSAAEKFRKAIEINPKNEEALSDWGRTLAQKASLLSDTNETITLFQNADEKFREATEINPKDDVTFNYWGVSHAQKANLLSNTDEKIISFQSAEEKFRKASELNHKNDVALSNWGIALFQKANLLSNADEQVATLQSAEEKLKKATDLNPKNNVTFSYWGRALTQKANLLSDTNEKISILQNAEGKYKKAIELNPKNEEAFDFWGATLLLKADLLSDPDEKITTLQNVEEKFKKDSELDPKNEKAFSYWGATLLSKANLLSDPDEKITTFQDAEEKFKKATDLNTKNYIAFEQWGIALYLKSRLFSNTDKKLTTLQSAEEKFRKAFELDPTNSIAHGCLQTCRQELSELLGNSGEH